METREFLGTYYEELFFGNVNKRYRSMTTGEMKKRAEKLTRAVLEEVEKPNELSDIHAMLAKVCAYLMHKEHTVRSEEQKKDIQKYTLQAKAFCRDLAEWDLKFLPDLTGEELEQILKMQGIRRYLLTNSLERSYQLFYIPKTIQRGFTSSM